MQFKKGLGWKACYDEERNLYTAQTSWRGDYHLYEINSEIWSQLGEPGVDSDKLIHSGRHLYYSQDSPIGPPTDMVIDENYAELGTWTNIQKSGNVMSEELTDIAVDLWENEETREQRNKMKDCNNRIQLVRLPEEHTSYLIRTSFSLWKQKVPKPTKLSARMASEWAVPSLLLMTLWES